MRTSSSFRRDIFMRWGSDLLTKSSIGFLYRNVELSNEVAETRLYLNHNPVDHNLLLLIKVLSANVSTEKTNVTVKLFRLDGETYINRGNIQRASGIRSSTKHSHYFSSNCSSCAKYDIGIGAIGIDTVEFWQNQSTRGTFSLQMKPLSEESMRIR